MGAKRNARGTSTETRLDAEPYSSMVRETRELVDRALSKYGEPRISLAELRSRVDSQLTGISLTEVILEEREAAL